MAEVVEFPHPEYIVTCRYCGSNVFYLWLGSLDVTDYKEYECANEDCGAIFSFSDIECELDDS